MAGGGAFFSSSLGGGAGLADDSGNFSGFAQTRLGIDRPAVDGVSAVVPLLTSGVYEHRVWPRLRASRPHALWSREVLPPHSLPPWSGTAATPFLASSCVNRTRTACTRLKWFPNGQRLLAGTQPGELAVWSGTFFGFEDLKRLPQGGGAITAMEWSGTGDRLFVGDASGLVVVLSQALNPLENEPLKGLSHPVLALSASPLTSQLLAGCADTVDPLIWDVNRLSVSRVLRAPNLDSSSSSCLHWHPLNSLIASGSKSSWIYLWDPRDAQPVATLQPHRGTINKVVFHPHGSLLLTCSRDTLIRSIDLRMLRPLHLFRVPRPSASSSSSSLASGGAPGAAEPLQLALNPVHSNLFVTGDNHGQLTFFSLLQPAAPLLQLQEAHGGVAPSGPSERAEGAVVALDWHPLGNLLASAADSRLMRFWSRGVCGGVAGDAMQTVKLVELQNGGLSGDFPVAVRCVKNREVVDKRKRARRLVGGGSFRPICESDAPDALAAGAAAAAGHASARRSETSDEEEDAEDWDGWLGSSQAPRTPVKAFPRIARAWLVGRRSPAPGDAQIATPTEGGEQGARKRKLGDAAEPEGEAT
ncbi:WD domain, G-beta repeat-containing protein [Besnoitia besnoiti]|uniref:WD domain, G-beta repeat-containing protein n=1 Tax=Besnoitia besnoiti TaxID=94643 RepID=A0A2A9MFS1_BESBE|nr:WD domain, G-beta repeat-containing protein [Besnoitia besnoiti]PFH34447.1 WD domain, G-beta repeat-containing protein [Besnoitia besnoiti]